MTTNDWILVFLAGLLLYKTLQQRNEPFVPYNSFEAPPNTDSNAWNAINTRYGQIVQIVNSQKYAMTYNMEQLLNTLEDVLNSSGIGKFKVVSVGKTTPFTLVDVIVTDGLSNQPITFDRVDFMVNSMNPFIIERVLLTPSESMLQQLQVQGQDNLSPDTTFRIKNPLGLFYPYATSFNEMAIDQNDISQHVARLQATPSTISTSSTLA